MKAFKRSLITLLLLIPSVFALPQIVPDTAKINFIKTQFVFINNKLNLYQKTTKEDTLKTTEGNEITAYYDAGDIKKITAVYYGETSKFISEYYFYNKRLIFYYSQNVTYDLPINATKAPGKIAVIKEKRYYLNNETIIKYVNNPMKKLTVKEVDYEEIEVKKETKRLLSFVSLHHIKPYLCR